MLSLTSPRHTSTLPTRAVPRGTANDRVVWKRSTNRELARRGDFRRVEPNGNLTCVITNGRTTSSELLKYRNGLFMRRANPAGTAREFALTTTLRRVRQRSVYQ
jgi:hypothetical protein